MTNFIQFHSLGLSAILKPSLRLCRDFSDSGLQENQDLLQDVILQVTRAKGKEK